MGYAAASGTFDPTATQSYWVPVTLDGEPRRLVARIGEDESGLLIRRLDLVVLRLPVPAQPPVRYEGEDYYPAEYLPELLVHADVAARRLWILSPEMPVESPAQLSVEDVSERWFTMVLNGQETGHTALTIQSEAGELYLADAALRMLGIEDVPGTPTRYEGRPYYALRALPGASARVIAPRQELFLEVSAGAFRANRLSPPRPLRLEPTLSPPGAFINYELVSRMDRTRRIDREDEKHVRHRGLVELGFFNRWGVGTANVLGRSTADGHEENWTRLETAWVHDRPGSATSLKLGDSITYSGTWGHAVRFGGLQWGSAFRTRPDLITFPLPSVQGESALPSTLDIYIENSLKVRTEIPAGPFTLTDVPVVTGAGQLQTIVRDALGREQQITQPFYASTNLLRRGLHEYSYAFGAVRRDYGLQHANYGPPLMVSTHRYGFTDAVTGELRAELLERQQTLGLAQAVQLGTLGVAMVGGAASRADDATGALGTAALQRQGRRLRFGGEVTWKSEDFVQLGMPADAESVRLASRISIGLSLGRGGTFTISRVYRDRRDDASLEILSGSYQVRLGRIGALRVNTFYPSDGAGDAMITASIVRSIGARTTASAGGIQRDDGTTYQARLQRNLPRGRGVGYRLYHQDSENSRRTEAGVDMQHGVGRLSLETAQAGELESHRVSASGGAALLGGGVFLNRRLHGSSAVVDVAGMEGIRVYQDNHPVARTNSRGRALVPNLRPYERNRLRIEHADLPLGARIDGLEREVAPYYRGGALVKFDVTGSNDSALLIVHRAGEPLPAGAEITLEGRDDPFPVGFEGEVYVTGLAQTNHLIARWGGEECTFEVYLPEAGGPQPELGPFECRRSP